MAVKIAESGRCSWLLKAKTRVRVSWNSSCSYTVTQARQRTLDGLFGYVCSLPASQCRAPKPRAVTCDCFGFSASMLLTYLNSCSIAHADVLCRWYLRAIVKLGIRCKCNAFPTACSASSASSVCKTQPKVHAHSNAEQRLKFRQLAMLCHPT